MKHIFGPVNSRRLGRSLGIDLFSQKICNLNCIYCEVGPTELLTCGRGEYVKTKQIIDEIRGYDYLITPRAVDVQIFGLRKKLGPVGACIETVRGIGYRFRE